MFTKIRSSFTLQVYCYALGIALACLLLMVLTWLQGPRVRSATLDANLVTTAMNQQLLLHMSQPPGSISESQVRVAPETPFAVTSSGNTVAIQFTQPLQNDTSYAVTIQTSNKRYTIHHTFHTGAATFYYAINTQYSTEIRRQTVGANTSQVIYTGRKVNDYLVLGNTLVLSVRDVSSNNAVLLYDIPSKQSHQIPLPGNGTASQLRSAPGKRIFGFIYNDSGNNTNGNIYLYDMNTRQLRQTGLLQDHPIKASEWQLARNGATVLARTLDNDTLLVNPGTTPIPLGQYSGLFGFSHDDSNIFVRDAPGEVLSLNVKSKQQTPYTEQGSGTYVAEVFPLSTRHGYIVRSQTSAGGAAAQKVFINQRDNQKELFASASSGQYLDDISPSPNDQLLAVEIRTTGSDTHKTQIIDINTGRTLATIEGAMVRWPSGP